MNDDPPSASGQTFRDPPVDGIGRCTAVGLCLVVGFGEGLAFGKDGFDSSLDGRRTEAPDDPEPVAVIADEPVPGLLLAFVVFVRPGAPDKFFRSWLADSFWPLLDFSFASDVPESALS